MISITIAIITCKRPASLANTLQSLKNLTLPYNTDIRLLVVDNDSGQSALETVNSAGNCMPKAASASNYIAFIDDDDTADPEWLWTLYDTAQTYRADVVKGQVRYIF